MKDPYVVFRDAVTQAIEDGLNLSDAALAFYSALTEADRLEPTSNLAGALQDTFERI